MSGLLERVRLAVQDRYSIDREIGRGAAAVVFQAEDRKHHRLVAIKVLRPEVAAEIGADRFIREIETVARLTHPHIVPLFDSGEADGLPYFVMPFVPGESLRERLAREHQLPVDDAMEIARDVASALGFAHSHGIVHRDIKPANILLSAGHAIVADFGVARAISAAIDGDAERGQGEVFGTPLYMSPEQLSGSSRLDGRSDLYSLGCVLYEMLAGHPPFVGTTAEELRTQHLLDQPASLASVGRDLPPEVDETVRCLLAKVPADRFATAQQLADGLPVIARPSPRRTLAVPAIHDRRRGRPRWITGIIAAALILGVSWGLVRSSVPPPESNRYVVLSIGNPMGGQDSRYVEALRAELVKWRGIGVARELEVLEVVEKNGAPQTVENARDIAVATRSANLVRLEQQIRGDSLLFGVELYDVVNRQRLMYESLTCPVEGDACDAGLREVAWRLLAGPGLDGMLLQREPGTVSVEAFRAYAAGKAAYGEWRLGAADSLLQVAVEKDPTFADAHLQLAEVRWWRRRPAAEWREELSTALAGEATLTRRSAVMARGLLALAQRRYPEACGQFDQLIARDSSDFAAWFGRGDCLERDRVVLRDARSPSGWRYRASFDAAIASYRRALALSPGIHQAFGERAFAQLSSLFYVDEYRFRPGTFERSDSMAFASWPGLDADTIAFVPWNFIAVMNDGPGTHPTTQLRAVLRNRSLLADVTAEWLRAFPQSAEAHLARSGALEVLREGGPSGSWDEVIDHAVAAQLLAPTRARRVEAGIAEVRLRVKVEDYAGAVRVADSLISNTLAPDTASARRLAGAAVMIGQIGKAIQLTAAGAPGIVWDAYDGQMLPLPTPVTQAAWALLVYSAIGLPVDSIATLEKRLDERLAGYLGPTELAVARLETTERAAVLAFGSAGLRPAHRNPNAVEYLIPLQLAAARGDFGAVTDSLHALERRRSYQRPSSVAIDGPLMEVQLLLMTGDTAAAIQRLNVALNSLSGYGRDLLGPEVEGVIPQMGSLGRAMVLRADLAAKDGDTESARRWAGAAATLWEKADPVLQPTVARMRALAGRNSTPAR